MVWEKGKCVTLDAEVDREEWLARRQHVVTGSGMAKLMGLSPWANEDKLLNDYILGDDKFVLKRPMVWGLNDEVHIGNSLARCFKGVFRPSHRYLESATHPIGATEDGEVSLNPNSCPSTWEVCPSGHIKKWEAFREEAKSVAVDTGRGTASLQVELKCSGGDQLRVWNNVKVGPPKYYWAQCQTQMFCFGLDAIALVAKIGAHDIRGHVIYRDDAFLEEAAEKAVKFMDKVKEGRSF